MDTLAPRRMPRAGAVKHHLFVSDADCIGNRRIMIDVLAFILSNRAILDSMELSVTAHYVTRKNRADPSYIQWLKARGVVSLPALVTPTRVYSGLAAIKNIYIENIQKFKNSRAPRNSTEGNPLSTFYEEEVLRMKSEIDGGADSDSDNSNDQSKDMMSAFHKMAKRRGGGEKEKHGGVQQPTPPVLQRDDNLAINDDPDEDTWKDDDDLMDQYLARREESM